MDDNFINISLSLLLSKYFMWAIYKTLDYGVKTRTLKPI